ncbi:MAG: tetratricopeptide repeat protein, partial [Myxococcales bacterium]
ALATPSSSAPLNTAEQATAKRYIEALAQGRVKTRKKDFAGAVAAFDQALEASPHDARALAERGFARLQTGDLDGAERDMHAALDRTPDRAVLSATTYNLALVADKRGNKALGDELREAARGNRRPGSQGGTCDSIVRRGKQVEDPSELKTLQTLRQVRAELMSHAAIFSETIEPPLPTTNEEGELRKAMLGDGPGPWELTVGNARHLLFGQPGDYRLRLGVDGRTFSRCGGPLSSRVDLGGHPVASSVYQDLTMVFMCTSEKKSGELFACGSTDAPDEQPAGSACFSPWSYTIRATVYDRATGEARLSVRQERSVEKEGLPGDTVRVLPRADGAQLLGGGCNQLEPFVK